MCWKNVHYVFLINKMQFSNKNLLMHFVYLKTTAKYLYTFTKILPTFLNKNICWALGNIWFATHNREDLSPIQLQEKVQFQKVQIQKVLTQLRGPPTSGGCAMGYSPVHVKIPWLRKKKKKKLDRSTRWRLTANRERTYDWPLGMYDHCTD
jgi:hypothetical protein